MSKKGQAHVNSRKNINNKVYSKYNALGANPKCNQERYGKKTR